MSLRTLNLVIAFVFAAVVPAFAHHPFARFDSTKTVVVSGTVKEFEWRNPHSFIQLIVQDAVGKQVQWSIELGSAAQQAKLGWKPDSVRIGDKVSIALHPLKDGLHGGQFISATLVTELSRTSPGATRLVGPSVPPAALEAPDTQFAVPHGETNVPRMLMIGFMLTLLSSAVLKRYRMSRLGAHA